MRKFVASVALATAFVVGGLLGGQPAQASTLLFTLSGTDNYSWYLDSTPSPTGFETTLGGDFWFAGVGPAAYLIFWSAGQGGALTASANPGNAYGPPFTFDLSGPQIYSGLVSAPVFVTGVFTGFTIFSGGSSLDTLTISQTPLPAALPLFATGLGALGLLGWRRKRKAAALAA
jgi:hypothetical protein